MPKSVGSVRLSYLLAPVSAAVIPPNTSRIYRLNSLLG